MCCMTMYLAINFIWFCCIVCEKKKADMKKVKQYFFTLENLNIWQKLPGTKIFHKTLEWKIHFTDFEKGCMNNDHFDLGHW